MIGEDRLEELLVAGDLDAAARHLVAQPLALAVEVAGGKVQATISCPNLGCPIQVSGDTAASAILAAWATCLLKFWTATGAESPCQSSA